MSRRLDDLSPRFRPLACELLARLMEANIPVMIIETFRTAEKHAQDVASGHSWVAHSKHQDGDAIDICPYGQFDLHGPDKLEWDATDPIWARIAVIGESLGLGAGYRWKQVDAGHFEWQDRPAGSQAA